ncbi:TMV resistance protein N [Capsella rubella]|nr:TMV resistance protein N [Capsella rubella]
MTSLTSKYDVFLSFRGDDTRRTFSSFLYKELVRRNIRTFKDDKELEIGQRISPELDRAIGESRFAVVVVSKNYTASSWCLEELRKIMYFENQGSMTVIPIFYDVNPMDVRFQIKKVAEHFEKHEAREDHEKVLSWRRALWDLSYISSPCSWKCEDDLKIVNAVAEDISNKLMIVTSRTISNGRNIVEIDKHMKDLNRLMDLNSKKGLRMVGIWARGCNARSALAKYVYQTTCQHFESHCFLGNVRKISQGRHIHVEFQKCMQGKYWTSYQSLKTQRVLLVADDVDSLEQLHALKAHFRDFGPGSVVIITTQDKQLLISYGIKLVHEIEFLRFHRLHSRFFRTLAFKKRDINATKCFRSLFLFLLIAGMFWLYMGMFFSSSRRSI